MEISGEQIIREFLERWLMNVNIRMWVRMLTREEFETYLNEEFETTMKMFEGFMTPIQTQNLSLYLELKKAIQQMRDTNIRGLLELYDKSKSSIVEG